MLLRMLKLARYKAFTFISGQLMSIVWAHYQPHHFEDYLRLVGDERVMAMITEQGLSREQAEVDYAEMAQQNRHHPSLGSFRVCDGPAGVYLGLAKLSINSPNATEAELGYMLLPEYWGQGWGSKIAEALLATAKSVPQLRRLVAIIGPMNAASKQILLKLGFVTTWIGELDGLPAETLRLELLT